MPTFIPDPETQRLFNASMKNSFTLTFDSWERDRKTINTALDYQLDIGSSSTINTSNYLSAAHKTEA